MVEIPTLETDRLRLRAHRADDLDACAQMWGDPAVARYIGGRPFTREEVWARMLRYTGHWAWHGFGFWLIEELQTGRFVGEVGVADFRRDMEPPLLSGPEAGWALASHAQGKGFATEALICATGWHQSNRSAHAISCLIHPENEASINVATKCGFRAAYRAAYKGQPTIIYILPGRPCQHVD